MTGCPYEKRRLGCGQGQKEDYVKIQREGGHPQAKERPQKKPTQATL